MTETTRVLTDLVSYSQLVQELINGSVRRHTFSQAELELLFDLQNSRIRKSSRPETLRRYLRAAQQQVAAEGTLLRLSSFLDRENGNRNTPAAQVVNPAATVSRQLATLPHAG